MQPYPNPNYYNQYYQPSYKPRMEIIKVNGRAGAEAYQLAPNSSVLLLDINEPILYYKETDGAGYPNVTAYSIAKYEEPKEHSDLESRIERLEKIIDESYIKSDEYNKAAATNKTNATANKRKNAGLDPEQSTV